MARRSVASISHQLVLVAVPGINWSACCRRHLDLLRRADSELPESGRSSHAGCRSIHRFVARHDRRHCHGTAQRPSANAAPRTGHDQTSTRVGSGARGTHPARESSRSTSRRSGNSESHACAVNRSTARVDENGRAPQNRTLGHPNTRGGRPSSAGTTGAPAP